MDKKKLIVITVTNDLTYDQRMQRHARVLTENGFSVLLIGRKRSFSVPLTTEVFNQKRLTCWFSKGKLFYLEYNLRLLFYLLFINADIFLAVDLDTLLPNTLIAGIKHKKLVFDAHEYFTEVPELKDRKLAKVIWQWVANICIPHTHARYTVGTELADLFSNQYNLPFQTIMNVPLLAQNEKPVLNGPKIILYQGALNEGRGLEQLILAMKNLEAILWIAGEGDLSNYLRELVIKNKLEQKVKFLGFVSPKDLPALTEKAYLGCNLLEPKGLSYQFSLANKFFDYMHSGLPQICADFTEYRKINERFEVAVLSNCDILELTAKTNKLLTDKELYQRLQNNCKLASAVYNLQAESKKLVHIFNLL